jgi:hypothetical protein
LCPEPLRGDLFFEPPPDWEFVGSGESPRAVGADNLLTVSLLFACGDEENDEEVEEEDDDEEEDDEEDEDEDDEG